MKPLRWIILWPMLFVGSCITGCAVHGPKAAPKVDALVWSKNIAYAEELWRPEVEQRFGSAVIVVCHGGYRNGVWCCLPDAPRPAMPVEAVAWTLHETYRKPIIFITCNAEGHTIKSHPPQVWYAMRNVSVAPGFGLPCCATSITEFRD